VTRVIYQPRLPALEMRGHAGAGIRGRDPVCAALSILLFTLLEGTPGAQVTLSDGYSRVKGGDRQSYALIAKGVRLLAENYPEFVRMEVKDDGK